MKSFTRGRHIRVVEDDPDVATRVMAAWPGLQRRAQVRLRITRTLLCVTAALQTYLAVPDLTASDHESHHVAVFSISLAVAMAYAAWRPARAMGVMPLLVAVAIGLTVTAGIDIVRGLTTVSDELPHLLVLAEVGLVWQVQRHGIPRSRPPARQAMPDEELQQDVA